MVKRYIIFNEDGISEAVDDLDGEEYAATYLPRDYDWQKDYQAIDTETGDIYEYGTDEDGAEHQWWLKGNISDYDEAAIESESPVGVQMPLSVDGGFLLRPEAREALLHPVVRADETGGYIIPEAELSRSSPGTYGVWLYSVLQEAKKKEKNL